MGGAIIAARYECVSGWQARACGLYVASAALQAHGRHMAGRHGPLAGRRSRLRGRGGAGEASERSHDLVRVRVGLGLGLGLWG